MIRHDIQCYKCDYTEEVIMEYGSPPPCSECGGETRVIFTKPQGKDWFKPGYWPDLFYADEPQVEIESKSHLKQLCDERGAYARCLLEEVSDKRFKQEITPTRRPAVIKQQRLKKIENDVVETAKRLRIFD